MPLLLLTPGPLSTSRATREAALQDYGSRDPAFVRMVREVRERLAALLDPSGAFTCVPIQGSGTFAVEAMLSAFVPPAAGLLVGVNGAYGERMALIAERYGRRVVRLNPRETEPIDPARVQAALAGDPGITHVAVVYSETTTGLLNDVDAIADVVESAGRRLLIDAMSAFGALPLHGRPPIDAVAASANKCLEGLPGLAFVLARTGALAGAGPGVSLSLDLVDQWQRLERDGQFRFTPPTHVIAALSAALDQHAAEGGVAGRGARYAANRDALVAGLRSLGFQLLLAEPGPIIVTVHSPRDPRWDFDRFYQALVARGFAIYPGKLADADTFRVGCIGQVFPDDIARFLGAVAEALESLGVRDTRPAAG